MSDSSNDDTFAHLRGWVGKTETIHDRATPRLLNSLRATFDMDRLFPSRAGMMPVAAHWCLAPSIVNAPDIGDDGHPRRGGFLPPVPLPMRMWASSDITYTDQIRDDDQIERRSTVADLVRKEGGTGTLVFVYVDHVVATQRGTTVSERQTIVYRDAQTARPAAPATARADNSKAPADPAPHRSISVVADNVMLFRYSALTFNSHRIHYDHPYTTTIEKYPALVVHGPLQATLLAEFAADMRKGIPPRTFSFRALSPLFAGGEFFLHAHRQDDRIDLWITSAKGSISMRASACW